MTNIYFIKNEKNFTLKIGHSTNPARRLDELQIANADRLAITHILPNVEPEFETFIHEVCSRYLIGGEWFRGDVLTDHLFKHPWYKDRIVTYTDFVKQGVPVRQLA